MMQKHHIRVAIVKHSSLDIKNTIITIHVLQILYLVQYQLVLGLLVAS